VHMSEEVRNSSRVVPRAMLGTKLVDISEKSLD
jgi:amino acid transporter